MTKYPSRTQPRSAGNLTNKTLMLSYILSIKRGRIFHKYDIKNHVNTGGYMIIQLTGPNDEQLFINAHQIVRFTKAGDYTVIYFNGEQWMSVKEDPFYIQSLINS
ncbi:hypothetical protein PGN61_12390 [Klebsiella aerogenes]